MSSPDSKQNLNKLSVEALEELHERQSKILKNRKILSSLPDKGEQLRLNLKKVEHELSSRKAVQEIEESLKTLSLQCQNSEVLKDKHVQHICGIEKSPKKERYKPFTTLTYKEKVKSEKPTQLISLPESITLLAEQANKLPPEQIKKKIEDSVPSKEEDEGACSDAEETNIVNDESDSDKSEKT